MLERYARYKALELDSPAPRVLRISFNKPDTLNSLDADGHRELTYIWRDIDEAALRRFVEWGAQTGRLASRRPMKAAATWQEIPLRGA